jgi:hypothetical protein
MGKVLYFFSLLFFCYTSNCQEGLVINEFSQGSSGDKEYIELVVVGNRTCSKTTVDLRGWIFDDQNGWYGTASSAAGHYRFNINNSTWAAVPIGSIIVIYNPADKNTSLPMDVIDPANFKYIVPINGSNLFEQENSFPAQPYSLGGFGTGPSYVYPASSNTANYSPANSSWFQTILINNSSATTPGDVLSITAPSDRANAFFSISHAFPIIPPYRSPRVSINVVQVGSVAYLTDANYTNAASWAIGPVPANETPGNPNGGANTTWINSMRINPTSAPAAPTASVTQPNCTTTTGTITITAPTGSGFTYSIDGSSYQTGATFSGLAPAAYNVTVKNDAGCISAPASVTVNAVASAPAAPTASVTQPTCTTTTGTISVTAPTGTGFTYSIDGSSYQTSTTFSGLTPATYNVTVKNMQAVFLHRQMSL